MTGRSTSALPAEMRRPAVHADNLVAVSPFRHPEVDIHEPVSE
jgi:hypothetical protein